MTRVGEQGVKQNENKKSRDTNERRLKTQHSSTMQHKRETRERPVRLGKRAQQNVCSYEKDTLGSYADKGQGEQRRIPPVQSLPLTLNPRQSNSTAHPSAHNGRLCLARSHSPVPACVTECAASAPWRLGVLAALLALLEDKAAEACNDANHDKRGRSHESARVARALHVQRLGRALHI